jgi:hypothetical protein
LTILLIIRVVRVADGFGFIGLFLLAAAYTVYHVILRKRGVNVGAITIWVSVALGSASLFYLFPFVLDLELNIFAQRGIGFIYLGLFVTNLLEMVFLACFFIIAIGMHVVASNISGQTKCRLITLGVLGCLVLLPPLLLAITSFASTTTRDVGLGGLLLIAFVMGLLILGVAIGFAVCYIVFFFSSCRETTDLLEKMVNLSPERRALFVKKYRLFKIGGAVFVISLFVIYLVAASMSTVFANNSVVLSYGRALFAFLRVVTVLITCSFCVLVAVLFRATASESLDAREHFYGSEFENFAQPTDI